MKLFRWDAPGPYEVAFSTRLGGVSGGPFESLNLAARTQPERDTPENVGENRRRLCRAVGADSDKLALNLQRHTAIVNRARAGGRGVPGDGLWSDELGLPMLKLCADCVPIAVVRTDGDRPALALLHAGWRGLLEGVVAAGVATLEGRTTAIVGPSIGPCCYEVGPEVAGPFARRFGADVVHRSKLDLWTSAERALRAAGCARVDRLDLCTSCHPGLFFSYRRDGLTGAQGVVGLVA